MLVTHDCFQVWRRGEEQGKVCVDVKGVEKFSKSGWGGRGKGRTKKNLE